METVYETLTATAVHDGLGHVRVWLSFWDGWPHSATWKVSVAFDITVGSAEAVADAIERWIAEVWLPHHS